MVNIVVLFFFLERHTIGGKGYLTSFLYPSKKVKFVENMEPTESTGPDHVEEAVSPQQTVTVMTDTSGKSTSEEKQEDAQAMP